MTQTPKDEYIENVRLANDRNKVLHLIIEPWAETFDIPARDHVIISSKGPLGDGIDITFGEENCTVWGWTGSSMAVVHKGNIVVDVREIRMPSTPVKSMRAVGDHLWSNRANAELDHSDERQLKQP